MRVDPHGRALCSYQPREERAPRGGRALNVRELSPRGRQSRGTTRAHKPLAHTPAALCGCWDPRYWCSYQRRCVNAGPKASKQERAPPQGDQPEDWRAPSRRTVIKSGNTTAVFNTAGAFKPVSLELYTVSAHVVRRPAWFDFDCAVSEVVASLAPSCSHPLSLSISRRTSLRVPCPWNSAFVGSNESVGPVAVVSDTSLEYFHRRG